MMYSSIAANDCKLSLEGALCIHFSLPTFSLL